MDCLSPCQLQLTQHLACNLQFNLNIDEVDVATQVFEHWRKETGTPAFIEVECCDDMLVCSCKTVSVAAKPDHAHLTGLLETLGSF